MNDPSIPLYDFEHDLDYISANFLSALIFAYSISVNVPILSNDNLFICLSIEQYPYKFLKWHASVVL